MEAQLKDLIDKMIELSDYQDELEGAKEELDRLEKAETKDNDAIGRQKSYIKEIENRIKPIQDEIQKKIDDYKKEVDEQEKYWTEQVNDLEEEVKNAEDEQMKETYQQALDEAKVSLEDAKKQKEKAAKYNLEDIMAKVSVSKELIKTLKEEKDRLKKSAKDYDDILNDVVNPDVSKEQAKSKVAQIINNRKRAQQKINVGGYEMTRQQAEEELETLKARLEHEEDLDNIDDPDYNRQAILDRIAEIQKALGIENEREPHPEPPKPPRGPGEPGPGEPGPGEPGPGEPGPGEPGPGENKNIAPLYWQVYNKVATEHVSSPERFMYNMSKSVIMPWNQDMSTPEKILSVVGTPFRAIGKGLGFISTKIMGTDKKYEKMREAVNNLSPEEFSILTDTKHEAEMRGVKKDDLDFEFTADTMRQYKHNTLALDAISERVDRETADYQRAIANEREDLNKAIARFQEQLASDDYTPEQKAVIKKALSKILTEDLPKLDAMEKLQVQKRDRIFEGKEHRTAKYKDTEGWIFGKFNPDNREQNKAMEEYQKRYIEAVRSGNIEEIQQIQKEWQDFQQSQTRTVTVGSNIHNKISRGNYAVDGVKPLNMTPQTIGKQFLANLAVAGIISHAITAIRNQKMVDAAIANNNKNIRTGNAQNSNISYSQSKQIDVGKEINVDIDKAEQAVKNQSIVAGHTTREYGNLDQSAMENNGSWASGINTPGYLARDAQTHQATIDTIKAGDLGSALKYYREAIKTYKPEMESYASAHPGFDYSVLQAMNPDGLSEVEKLFVALQKPITVTVSGTVKGAQIAEMAGVTLGKSYLELAALLGSQGGHFVSKRKDNKKENNENNRAPEQENEEEQEQEDLEPGE